VYDQNGFYFNGNSMKIDGMKGDYRHHRFWSSGMYYVHAGTEFEKTGSGIGDSKKNAVVYIRSKANPEIYVHIREISDFVNIDVSRQNDFFYVRYKYKTEIMRLQKIVVSIDIDKLLTEEPKKLKSSSTNKSLKLGGGTNVKNYKSMKNIERIFEVRYLGKEDKVIEKFKLFKYKTEDLFLARSKLKLEVAQSRSSSINFNLLSFGNFIMFQPKSIQPIKTSSIGDNDAQLMAFDNEERTISTAEGVEIKKIYAVRNSEITFYFVNSVGVSSNVIYRYDSLT
jgi:hypothetical protein